MRLSSGASGFVGGVEWRGGGCWHEIVPWGTEVPAPTASLDFLSIVRDSVWRSTASLRTTGMTAFFLVVSPGTPSYSIPLGAT